MHELTKWQKIKSILFHLFPHHWVSRVVFFLSRIDSYLAVYPIRWFIRRFNVDMSEAQHESPLAYPNFNVFFTRALKPDVRPICQAQRAVASPCDGIVMQVGDCEEGYMVQAKAYEYTVSNLLGTHQHPFACGKFCTIYLAPKDYHRVHAPLTGQLVTMVHIPGRLFSVAPYATHSIDGLYTKNERVICLFNTAFGKMALVFIGAVNVAAIETVWSGIVSPKTHAVSRVEYAELQHIELQKGEECGRFNIGSTVILLLENSDFKWNPLYYVGEPVKMGAEIASLSTNTAAANA